MGAEMKFWTYGPFDVTLGDKAAFWHQTKTDVEWDGLQVTDLKHAIGCYLFAMRRGEKLIPYYVGKTTAKTGFEGEIFTPHKIEHYRRAVERRPSYRPQILLFPLTNATHDGFSAAHASQKPLIEWLEKILIGMALARNPDATNARDTKRLKQCIVDGVFGKQTRREKYDAAYYARLALTDQRDWIEEE